MSSTHNPEPPELLQKPYQRYSEEVLRRVWDRMHEEDQHNMIAIVGAEGSGKSMTALKLADIVDSSFEDNMENRIVFDVINFLEILENGDHEPGNAYILDEAGVSLGNRTWQDRSQILANQALQLIRSHNLTLFFTIPVLGDLDSQAIGRLQAFFEIEKKVQGEYVSGSWMYLDPDRRDDSGNVFKKYPRVFRNGQKIRVTELSFSPPPPHFPAIYEPMKKEHQKEMYRTVIEKSKEEDERKDGDDKPKADEIADEILSNEDVDEYIMEYNNGTQQTIDKELIGAEHGIGRRKAKRVKKLLKKQVEV